MPGAAQTGRHGQEPGAGHPGSVLHVSAENCAHGKPPGQRDLSVGLHGTDGCAGLGMPCQGSPAAHTISVGLGQGGLAAGRPLWCPGTRDSLKMSCQNEREAGERIHTKLQRDSSPL